MSKHTNIPQAVIKPFQSTHFTAFPDIHRLHELTAKQLIESGNLVTPFGRKRWFFGRRDDRDTLKQAVAHLGQAMTADEMNLGLIALWRSNLVQILLQC